MVKKKLLICGAYGLVGSNICKILERDYPEIKVTKVKFDTWDSGNLYKLQSFDYIIQAAGYGQPQMFGKDKIKTIYINTEATDVLFGLLKTNGKLLFVSSSEVYSGIIGPHAESMIGTTTPQHPRACYIEGKRCGEAICMAYREQGYDVKIARLSLAYGPGTKKGDTRAINHFIEQALTKGEIKLMDDGSDMRTYCYVDDACEMMLDVLFKGTQPVYNVGGVSRVTIKELADTIGMITQSPVILGNEKLKGSPDNVESSISLVTTEFPRTFIGLEEGLKRTIEYQKKII